MACIRNRVVRDVIAVAESVSCAEAARIMEQRGIGCVGVRRGDELLGIVTSRDLLGCLASGADAQRIPIGSALRRDVPAVSTNATDTECALLMGRHRTGHLAVEEDGQVVGVISLLNLCDLVVEEREWNIKLLQGRLRGQQLSPPITTMFNPCPRGRGFMGVAE